MKKGFTLIELLIALAIIGILIATIYPGYNDSLVKTRRTFAAIALIDAADRMEEYYALNNSYVGATIENLHVNTANYKNYYQITILAKADAYILRANPVGKQAADDVLCGTFTFDQSGNKSVSGKGSNADCW